MRRAGTCLFSLFLLMALFPGLVSPCDPWKRFDPYEPPGPAHWLGTNDLGNDVLAELIHGARASLVVGLGTGILATALGLLVGMAAGYYRGAVDEVLMTLTDVTLMVPRIPMVIIVGFFLRPGAAVMVPVLGLLWWASTARVVRSRAMQVRQMPFVAAARALGFGDLHILRTDVLPHLLSVLVPKFLLTVASAMITEASLSFLGLGDPSAKSWGMMIHYAFERGGFVRGLWWWYLAPGLATTLCVLSLVLIGSSAGGEEPLAAGPTE